ncbi:MAG: SDR family NAD(P)-dependent oxidoreductase [Acidimicrobiales bacterium]
MTDQVVVITGASDGIGAAAARLLRAQGEHVILVGRSPDKTKQIAHELDSPFYLVDFADLDQVRSLAERLQSDAPRIDVLANNAGGMMGGRLITVDGNELTLQVNHLAPFLLTNLLLETLIASQASVINTSSSYHRRAGTLDLNDLNLENGYSATHAYAKAKLMNILFTRELHERFHEAGVSAAAFHPGIVRTNFTKEFGGDARLLYSGPASTFLRSPERGAATLVWLAGAEANDDWTSGEYYKDRQVARTSKQAQIPGLAHSLWDLSLSLTKLA